MTKKFKDIVKVNPEPARGKSGTSPMDPWNAKSGLAEASEQQLLHRYLKSRGINPEFVPKDTKIAHSKSSSFSKISVIIFSDILFKVGNSLSEFTGIGFF